MVTITLNNAEIDKIVEFVKNRKPGVFELVQRGTGIGQHTEIYDANTNESWDITDYSCW